jgi:hypothetical protein
MLNGKQTMKTKMHSFTLAAAATALLLATSPLPTAGAAVPDRARPLVQIALLLDTSNSMDGLIEQAKGQLWKIVNEFTRARQRGQTPDLHVALFEYGKSSLPAAEGYLRQIQGFTTDLDKVSEELFALKTNGGDEYCGWVIREAVARLDWSKSPDVYRAIFIAGNEPFTQGPVSYVESCKAAIAKGILVNTIYCGNEATGIQTQWQDGALLADGKYMVIDHNRAVVHFEAPQDKEIARLSAALNKTYLAYGTAGRTAAARQAAQDANAAALAPQGAVFYRALAKSSPQYRNEAWDLVDAAQDAKFNLADLKTEDLPAEMQKLDLEQRKALIETKTRERADLQASIHRLNAERETYLAARRKEQAATNTLDSVVIATVREQARRQQYRFE